MAGYAQIALVFVQEPAQRIYLTYKLEQPAYANSSSLITEFNPTTILAGNNVHPAATLTRTLGRSANTHRRTSRQCSRSIVSGSTCLKSCTTKRQPGLRHCTNPRQRRRSEAATSISSARSGPPWLGDEALLGALVRAFGRIEPDSDPTPLFNTAPRV